MNWLRKLQIRWKVGSMMHVVIILLVFALTGTTVARLMTPALELFYGGDHAPVWAGALYIILILPVYNIFLLLFGFVFGQFYFFWNFEKKMFRKIGLLFRRQK